MTVAEASRGFDDRHCKPIKLLRKSNSNQLRGRQWRSRHGVLTVRAFDTLVRARLQAWMDRLRAEWQ
jgi:hypothetical protein